MNDPKQLADDQRIQKAARRFAEAMCRQRDVDADEVPQATKFLMDGFTLIAKKALSNPQSDE